MTITKEHLEHLRCFIQPDVTTSERRLAWNVTVESITALIALAQPIVDGTHVIMPGAITKEMAWELENNFAEPLPPSEIHRANWDKAYRAMIAAANQLPSQQDATT